VASLRPILPVFHVDDFPEKLKFAVKPLDPGFGTRGFIVLETI
jgi:hypothetical protein